MDNLLREFLIVSAEHLDTVDAELARFERDPTDQAVLRHVLRLVHTIKGTSGSLGLPRLEALAHAAETLMGCFRDGAPVSPEAVTLVLATLERLKGLLGTLEVTGAEPKGTDQDLVGALERMAEAALTAPPMSAAPPTTLPGKQTAAWVTAWAGRAATNWRQCSSPRPNPTQQNRRPTSRRVLPRRFRRGRRPPRRPWTGTAPSPKARPSGLASRPSST